MYFINDEEIKLANYCEFKAIMRNKDTTFELSLIFISIK
jgi:hypothetical protein